MERELKYALADREAYAALATALGVESESLAQVNYYFDNADGVVSQGGSSAVRVRSENEREWELTYKFGRRVDGAYFQAEELNESLLPELARRLLNGDWPEEAWESGPMRQFRELYGDRPMVFLGRMRNLRRRFDLDGETVELDATDFPDGTVDYEVEVETEDPDRMAASLQRVADAAGVQLLPQLKTKFGRFLSRRGDESSSSP